ncbi:LysM peptidoglycan-binding domain-containing protein [Streptomyces populi]
MLGEATGPREGTCTHTVVNGDTLWDIAARNLSGPARLTEVYNANQAVIEAAAREHPAPPVFGTSDHGHWIFPGTMLTIPGASCAATTTLNTPTTETGETTTTPAQPAQIPDDLLKTLCEKGGGHPVVAEDGRTLLDCTPSKKTAEDVGASYRTALELCSSGDFEHVDPGCQAQAYDQAAKVLSRFFDFLSIISKTLAPVLGGASQLTDPPAGLTSCVLNKEPGDAGEWGNAVYSCLWTSVEKSISDAVSALGTGQ